MALFDLNLEISQGTTFRRQFILESGGEVVDLSDYTAKCQFRLTPASPDIIHELSTENGGITIDGPAGLVTLIIPPSITGTFTFNSTGAVYDVELYHSNNADDIMSLVGGMVKLSLQVTR